MKKLKLKNDRLLDVYKLAEENCRRENRLVVLESDVVYAILAASKSVIGITCKKLGLSSDLLKTAIANEYYPPVPFSSAVERLAIDYFSKLPEILEMALPEHILFVLARTTSFSECLTKLDIDPVSFVSEMYRRSGKDIADFPME